MKPVRLSMCAFGAFADTVEVDFEALAPRGLFLVSGPTGAGKTTIFDAMCWALYGKMPLKDVHGVRSDHVPDSTRCEVSFTFDCDGERYTVTRNPEQLRPAKGSSNRSAKEEAKAELVHHTGDGTEVIATRVTEVAEKCEALIGLNATQFQRVILLPQGDVSRFLLADTGERGKILETLFGDEIFDQITKELKADWDQQRQLLNTSEVLVSEKLDGARTHLVGAAEALDTALSVDLAPDGTGQHPDRVALQDALEVLQKSAQASQTEAERAGVVHARAVKEHERAETGADRFRRAEGLWAALVELDTATEQVSAARAAAEASIAARPVVAAADALDQATAAKRIADANCHKRVKRITAALAALAAPLDILTPVALFQHGAELRSTQQKHVELLDAQTSTATALEELLADRACLDAEIERLEAEQTKRAERRDQLEAGLPALRPQAVDLTGITAAITAAEKVVANRAQLVEVEKRVVGVSAQASAAVHNYARLLATFVDTQAPRLAEALVDGQPCPVCGSTEHPEPAVSEGAAAVSWAEVEEAGTVENAVNDQLRVLRASLQELRGGLAESADASKEELSEKVEALKADLAVANAAHAQIERDEDELKKLSEELQVLGAGLGAKHEARTRSDVDLATAQSAVRNADAAAVGVDPEEVARRTPVLDELDVLQTGYDVISSAVASAEVTVRNRREDLQRTLADSSYSTVEEARALLVSSDLEQEAIERAVAHDEQRSSAAVALKTLEGEGIPETCPDVSRTEAELGEAHEARKRLEAVATAVKVHLANAVKALAEFDGLRGATVELRTRVELAERAYRVCSKGGPVQPVSLKLWVLAHELDRITAAANLHLQAMTNGRYTLHRVVEQRDGRRTFGLDLEVGDANTGRRRATSSLSGGEQFQASLALALGLADVISHGGTASGRRFEALFVDEGFGSLSSEALDDAVETLTRLQDTGRMVGAITHVESMKEVLHVGIAVHKRDDGRGSTLTVSY